MTGFTAADVPDQSGRTIMVTGANTGVGFEVAKVLADKGARVLLGCRDEGRARAAMSQIRSAVPGADLMLVPLDQADLASVRRAAEIVSAAEPQLDVLVNNAGLTAMKLARTAQGFEMNFGVNVLGTFALTALLLPKLAETAGSRVVMTGSLAHRRARLNWDDLAAEQGRYDVRARYAQSKLADMLILFELDRRLRAAGSPVCAALAHPGIAVTELFRDLPAVLQPVVGAARLFLNSVPHAALPTLQAATAPGIEPGSYFGPSGWGEVTGRSARLAQRRPGATDPAEARRLWDVCLAMTGIDPGLPPV